MKGVVRGQGSQKRMHAQTQRVGFNNVDPILIRKTELSILDFIPKQQNKGRGSNNAAKYAKWKLLDEPDFVF